MPGTAEKNSSEGIIHWLSIYWPMMMYYNDGASGNIAPRIQCTVAAAHIMTTSIIDLESSIRP
eukprot:scaffold7947_cov52-Cyclotella_meneghiniana.AAC.1